MLVCLLCDAPLSQPSRFCTDCHAELPWNRACCQSCAQPLAQSQPTCSRCHPSGWLLTRVLAPLRYEFPVDRILLKSKAGKRPDLLPAMAALLLPFANQRSHVMNHTRGDRWLVPIPLSQQRQRERGYNQSGLLANYLGRRLGIGVAHDALLRRHERGSQKSRSLAERQRALRRAFQLNPVWHSRLSQVDQLILVDDVITSGQTLQHAAAALGAINTSSIEAWTVAATVAKQN